MTRMSRTNLRTTLAVAAALGLGLTLTACSVDDAGSAAPGKEVSIGIHSGWDEGIAVSHLFKVMLEDDGYRVTTETADPGIVYTGLAGGGLDLNFDMWLPITHADYLTKYGDDLEQLGSWYDEARLTIAVNEDAPITSLEELAGAADAFDGRLVGIEAGAGLTRITQDEVVPGYGLEKIDHVISSTPAMLAELKSRTGAGENVAVTLWRPHWAYDEFPVRDLEDPKGLLGDAEEIHTVARSGFSAAQPDVAALVKAFELSDDQLTSLENVMFNEDEGKDPDTSVRTWLAANPTFVEDLRAKAGLLP
ncbi:glycine betaine ABC transporter substrate-binding protein [Sanguibacter sp. HDW7]|uniref:glycine betaine ABC transporter substrate-binding protein n=1 Tax=Sanguibacter sp. HDW7 TaxID=2714931 RepID=UPI00140ED9D9|nr:glycine betaine ABC transporter substrate-binding protein [Sanguibacter sp. HDW7]QIK84622.1 glycine betaine ABC transporter substrate-binding protein [Sanguibacter sp. HDW7]